MAQHLLVDCSQLLTNAGDGSCVIEAHADPLVLDPGERCIQGAVMAPLLGGEFKLLSYLGERSLKWHSSEELSVRVYRREDVAGRQLVWKYASTLRKKR